MSYMTLRPSYMTISSQEKHPFLLFSYFRTHPTTLLLKILGGRMHGPSPHLKLWGGPPPRFPPLPSSDLFDSSVSLSHHVQPIGLQISSRIGCLLSSDMIQTHKLYRFRSRCST